MTLQLEGEATQGRNVGAEALHSYNVWLEKNSLPPQLDTSDISSHPLGVNRANTEGPLLKPLQYLGLGPAETGETHPQLPIKGALTGALAIGSLYALQRLSGDIGKLTADVTAATPSTNDTRPSKASRHLSRRDFLKLSALAGAGVALAACTGSSGSPEPPAVSPPKDETPVSGPTPTIAVDKKILDAEPGLAQYISNPASPEAQSAFQEYVTKKAGPVMAAYQKQFNDYGKQPELYVAKVEGQEAEGQYDVWIKVEGENGRKWVYTGWDDKGENGRFAQTLPGMQVKIYENGMVDGVNASEGVWIPKYSGYLAEFPDRKETGRQKAVIFDPRLGMTVSYDDKIPAQKAEEVEDYLYGNQVPSQDGLLVRTGGIAPEIRRWANERSKSGTSEDQMMVIKYDDATDRFYSFMAAARPEGTVDYFFVDVEDNQIQVRNIAPIQDRTYLLNYITSEMEIVLSDNFVIGTLDPDGRVMYFDQIVTATPTTTSTRTPIAQVKATFTPTETSISSPTATTTKKPTLTPTLTPVPPEPTKIPEVRKPTFEWISPRRLEASENTGWEDPLWTHMTDNGGCTWELIDHSRLGPDTVEYTVKELRESGNNFRAYPTKEGIPAGDNPDLDWEIETTVMFEHGYLPSKDGQGISLASAFNLTDRVDGKWNCMLGLDCTNYRKAVLSVKDLTNAAEINRAKSTYPVFDKEGVPYNVILGKKGNIAYGIVNGKKVVEAPFKAGALHGVHGGAYGVGLPIGSRLLQAATVKVRFWKPNA